MINRVVLIGRLTRDPELRRTAQGDAVTSFTLAVNRSFTNADGQQQADFINCVVWKKTAENVERYCFKGSLVGVEGRLQSRTYENNQGQTVFVTEVVCSNVQFINTNNNQAPLNTEAVQQQANSWEQRTTQSNTNQYDYMNNSENEFSSFQIDEDDLQF